MSKEAIEYIEKLLAIKLSRKMKRWRHAKWIEYIDDLDAFYFADDKTYMSGSRIEVIEAAKMIWNDVRNTKYANEVMAIMLSSVKSA